MKKLLLLLMMLVCLASCAKDGGAAEIADPAALYSAVAGTASLPEMLALTEEELLYLMGIEPQWYTAAAAYAAADSTSPVEILILRAADDASVGQLKEALESRLKLKLESARLYLTENQSLLRTGVVRVDGLTVSLLVAEDMEAVLSVYP